MEKSEQEEGTILSPDFDRRGGLLTVVAQNSKTGEILIVAYANKEALEETIRSKKATFWSTSRNELWKKGETSGDFLDVEQILIDCDQDALIYRVNLAGEGACHTKDTTTGKARRSCFYRKVSIDGKTLLKL